jgi:stalled ribosome rescue protein Dom34
MKNKKYLGIWMDHSMAHLMELTTSGTETRTITAQPTNFGIDTNLKKDESRIQNKEQYHLADFFKKLTEVIRDFDDVILFGPTEAKVELMNTLRKDHRFDKIKIETRSSDKMTENQMLAFVKDYFMNEEE